MGKKNDEKGKWVLKGEVAEMLGVSYTAFKRIRARNVDFPKAFSAEGIRDRYLRKDIEKWAKDHGCVIN